MNTFGEYLLRTRKAKGIELSALSASTKIPLKILAAIEENRVNELPDPVFVRGFIRIICKELKTENNIVLELYENFGRIERSPVKNPMLVDSLLNRRESVSSIGENDNVKFTYLFIIILFLVSVIFAVFALGPSNTITEQATQADSINPPQ
jgi:cytoskeletal protein RodZ